MVTLDKSIRLSTAVKTRLDTLRGTGSSNDYVNKMINYFDVTGFNPNQPVRNPNVQVEKRLEDIVKIIKAQEREYFKPILGSIEGGAASDESGRLMEECSKLRQKIAKLEAQPAGKQDAPGDAQAYKQKLDRIVALIRHNLNPSKFAKTDKGDKLIVQSEFFELLIAKMDEINVL